MAQLNSPQDLKCKFKWCYFCEFGQKHRTDFYMAGPAECMKETESGAELIPPLYLRFAERQLTFGAQLEFMASAWRLCKVIVLLLLQERTKGSQTAELRRSSEVCFSCRQMAQTEDASALCRQSCQRAGAEVRVQMPSGWNRAFTSKVRREVWGYQMETETTRSFGGMICECWMTLSFWNTKLDGVLPESFVGRMWGNTF